MNEGDQGRPGARRAAGFSDDEPSTPRAARRIIEPDWDDEDATDDPFPAPSRPARAWSDAWSDEADEGDDDGDGGRDDDGDGGHDDGDDDPDGRRDTEPDGHHVAGSAHPHHRFVDDALDDEDPDDPDGAEAQAYEPHRGWAPARLVPAPGLIGSADLTEARTDVPGASGGRSTTPSAAEPTAPADRSPHSPTSGGSREAGGSALAGGVDHAGGVERPVFPWAADSDSPVTAEIPVAHAPFARPAGDDTVILQRITEPLISTPTSILEPAPTSPMSPSLGATPGEDDEDDDEPTVLLSRRPPEATHAAPRRSAAGEDDQPWYTAAIGRLPAVLRRPAVLAGLAGVLVVALVIGGVLWNRDDGAPSATTSRIAPDQVTVDQLATPTEAALLGTAGWAESQTLMSIADDSPIPLCLGKSADVPVAAKTVQRTLTASTSTLLHRIDGYAGVTEAERAFSARSAQLGRCSNVPVLITSGLTISGLGDAAVGIRAVLQDPTPIQHVVVVVRTGASIVILDAYEPTNQFAADAVAKLAAAVVARSCATSGGACPTANPTVTPGVPPAGGAAGWLAVADLPRITPGYGRWTAADPSSTIKVTGTQCENVTLADVPGPTARAQRSYVLTEDPKAPQLFGVDQVNLTFPTPAEADGFARTIADNITNCPGRVATAKVSSEADAAGTGAQGEAISVRLRTVVQTTASAQPVKYRVAIVTVGSRVIYLFANSSDSFDFTNAAWTQIAVRAGERATQG